jgi:hypothetical protein
MSSTPQLSCYAIPTTETNNRDLDDRKQNAKRVFLSQEKGKKSSYLLDGNEALEEPTSIDLLIEHDSGEKNDYFLGGFQLISNAKEIKVYLTGTGGTETYVTTSRAIPFEKESGESWFKVLCVIPGGPRSIKRFRLELMNLQPSDTTTTRIKLLKTTARIPSKVAPRVQNGGQIGVVHPQGLQQDRGVGSAFFPPTMPSSLPQMTQNDSQSILMSPTTKPYFVGAMSAAMNHSNFSPSTAPPVTQDDIGAAMTTLTMVARTAQEDMGDEMKEQFSKIEEKMEARWTVMEGYISSLTSVIVSQKRVLEEKNKIMAQQFEAIHTQSEKIAVLLNNQEELSSVIKSLQTDLSDLRHIISAEKNPSKDMSPATQLPQSDISRNEPGQEELYSTIKTIQSDVSNLIVPVKDNKKDEDNHQQQEEISSRVKALETDISALQGSISREEDQSILLSTVKSLETDLVDLRQLVKDNSEEETAQQQQVASTVKSIQLDVSELQQNSFNDDHQKELISKVKSLQKNLMNLRKNPYGDTKQHQQLSATVKSLQTDVKELRQSIHKSCIDHSQSTESNLIEQTQAEYTINHNELTPSFIDSDLLEIHSLDHDDYAKKKESSESSSFDWMKVLSQEDIAPPEGNMEETNFAETYESSNLDTPRSEYRATDHERNETKPPKPFISYQKKQNTQPSEFREITNERDEKPTDLSGSCPGVENIEVSLFDNETEDETPIEKEDNVSQAYARLEKHVSFNDSDDCLDFLEYERNQSVSTPSTKPLESVGRTGPSITSDFFAPGDFSAGTRSAFSPDTTDEGSIGGESDNSMFERGMKLFKYYSDL